MPHIILVLNFDKRWSLHCYSSRSNGFTCQMYFVSIPVLLSDIKIQLITTIEVFFYVCLYFICYLYFLYVIVYVSLLIYFYCDSSHICNVSYDLYNFIRLTTRWFKKRPLITMRAYLIVKRMKLTIHKSLVYAFYELIFPDEMRKNRK